MGAIREERSWWLAPLKGGRASHQSYVQVPQASAEAASTAGSGGLRVVLEGMGKDWEWLGWWLLLGRDLHPAGNHNNEHLIQAPQ